MKRTFFLFLSIFEWGGWWGGGCDYGVGYICGYFLVWLWESQQPGGSVPFGVWGLHSQSTCFSLSICQQPRDACVAAVEACVPGIYLKKRMITCVFVLALLAVGVKRALAVVLVCRKRTSNVCVV